MVFIDGALAVDVVGGEVDEYAHAAFVASIDQGAELFHRAKVRFDGFHALEIGVFIGVGHKRRNRPIRVICRIRSVVGALARVLGIHRNRRNPERVDAHIGKVTFFDFLLQAFEVAAHPSSIRCAFV